MSATNHRCLERGDLCIYYREKRRFEYNRPFTETDSVVANFKKLPSACRDNALMAKYKECAIGTIADDVIGLFRGIRDKAFLLVPAITSKSCDDPEFDDRLIRVCSGVAKALPNVEYADLLYVASSIRPAHTGGTRNVEAIASQIEVRTGFNMCGFDYVLIFDDVLTTGAHFKACQQVLWKAYGKRASGLFWAREESWG